MNIIISEVDSSENSNTFSLNDIQNVPIQNIDTNITIYKNEQKFNTYICGICNTEPSLLRKHELHLKTTEHVINKDICDLSIRPYILNLIPKNDEWKQIRKYFINENDYSSYDDLNLLKLCQKEKNRSFNLDDENDKTEYFNWKVDKIILDIETIQQNDKNNNNNYNNNNRNNNNNNHNNRNNNNHNNNNNRTHNYDKNNFNFNEINFILNNVNLDEILNLSYLEQNDDLICKQCELFERNLELFVANYESYDLNHETFTTKNAIKRSNFNFNLPILIEIIYVLFKNNLSYDILEVKNTLRVNYNIRNFNESELKFIWIYKNYNGEFSIIDEEKLMKKILIILQSLYCKVEIDEEYNYYNYLKQKKFSSKKLFDMLKGLFLLNDLI